MRHLFTRSRRTFVINQVRLESAKIYYFRSSTRSPKFGGIKFLSESMHCSAFAVETQSFLCGKFSTAWLEVLPNLRHAGVFQMSTMVNLGIGFQEPVTRPGVKLDKKMSICSSTTSHARSQGISKFQLLESDQKVRKCHAMLFLRSCMSQKWM